MPCSCLDSDRWSLKLRFVPIANRALAITLALTFLFGGRRDARAEAPLEPAIPDPLTLGEALRIFRSAGLDLLIADAAVEGATGDVGSARAIANPSVGGGYYRSFFSSGLFETSQGWFVSLGDSNAIADTLSGKRGLRVRVAEATLAATRMQRVDAERTAGLAVKEQYFQALLAGASLAFAREVAQSANTTFDLNQIRYRSGAISEVDLAKAETAKLESDQAVESAGAALRQSKVAIAFLLGRRTAFKDFNVDLHQLRFVAPDGLTGATAETLVERACASRPDFQALLQQKARAAASASLARRQRFPDVGVGAEYQQEGSGNRAANGATAITPPTVLLSVTATLPLFYQQQGEIRRADADVRIEDLQVARLRAQIVSEVETAFGAYQSSKVLVGRMEGRLLDRARRARELVELQYHKGAASLLEYLDAERTYIAINVEYLQELTAYWNSLFQLETATASEIVK